jgi:predicted O-linked N-acetylglucosamine transferase (SPINDLY family)
VATTSIQRRLRNGYERHVAGDTNAAAAAYLEILQEDPTNSEALHLSGLIAFQRKQFEDAAEFIRHALDASPGNVVYQVNLVAVLLAQNQATEAELICRRILKQPPKHVAALKHLGTALRKQNRLSEALSVLQECAQLTPDDSELLCNLGAVYSDLGRVDDALLALQRACTLKPDQSEIHLNLGAVFRKLGRFSESLKSLNRSIELAPDRPEAFVNRGNLFLELHQPDQSLQDYQRALELNPRSIAGLSGLSQCLPVFGQWNEALEAVRLANLLADLESQTDARAGSVQLRRRMMSNLLYCASLTPGMSREDVFEMHVNSGRSLEESIVPFVHSPGADPDKRLKIGYVSPDFRSHATMRFFLPFFEAHDHSRVEVHCYSEFSGSDGLTERVQKFSHGWCRTSELSDTQLAERIHTDGIDILVDLAGHTNGNRLPAFAHKPSPIQVSFLGYPNTTGMSRVDYLLVDAVRESSQTAKFFTEQLVAMPHGACCFQALHETPIEMPSPATRNGYITFGSTHRLEKLSHECLSLWAQVLRRVPQARLRVIRDVIGTSERLRRRLLQQLIAAGIDIGRVDLQGDVPLNHLEVYSSVDILLDVFPWPSGTTIYESMSMGVPMPTIADPYAGSRASASCLHFCGLNELIAANSDEYLDIVTSLVGDRERLNEMRSTLRSRLHAAFCEGTRFSRDLEAVYRAMWRRHCGVGLQECGLPLIRSDAGVVA